MSSLEKVARIGGHLLMALVILLVGTVSVQVVLTICLGVSSLWLVPFGVIPNPSDIYFGYWMRARFVPISSALSLAYGIIFAIIYLDYGRHADKERVVRELALVRPIFCVTVISAAMLIASAIIFGVVARWYGYGTTDADILATMHDARYFTLVGQITVGLFTYGKVFSRNML